MAAARAKYSVERIEYPCDRNNPDTKRPVKPRSMCPLKALISPVSGDRGCDWILLVRIKVRRLRAMIRK
jgi:hypothetical protein